MNLNSFSSPRISPINEQISSHKIKRFLHSKTFSKILDGTQYERKIFLCSTWDRGLLKRIYKELQILNTHTLTHCQSINGLMKRYFPTEDNYKLSLSIFKVFNIFSHQENDNLNCFDLKPHPSQNGYHKEFWQ